MLKMVRSLWVRKVHFHDGDAVILWLLNFWFGFILFNYNHTVLTEIYLSKAVAIIILVIIFVRCFCSFILIGTLILLNRFLFFRLTFSYLVLTFVFRLFFLFIFFFFFLIFIFFCYLLLMNKIDYFLSFFDSFLLNLNSWQTNICD